MAASRSARGPCSCVSTPFFIRTVGEPSAGHNTLTPGRGPRNWVVMPDRIVIGNSRPFEPWIVWMLSAASSVSGNSGSCTRAMDPDCSAAHWVKARRSPEFDSSNERAWSTRKRSRRHTSVVRGSPNASSAARRSRRSRSSNIDGVRNQRSRHKPCRWVTATATGCDAAIVSGIGARTSHRPPLRRQITRSMSEQA